MQSERAATRTVGFRLLIIVFIELCGLVLTKVTNLPVRIPIFIGILGLPAAIAIIVANERVCRFAFGYLAGVLGFVATLFIATILNVPLRLLGVEIRLRTLATLLTFISFLVDIGLIFWICLQLRSRIEIRSKYWLPLVFGSLIAITGPLAHYVVSAHDPSERAALAKARLLYGSQYEYSFAGYATFDREKKQYTSAKIVAYNQSVILELTVSDF